MAQIIQHPSSPDPKPEPVQEPETPDAPDEPEDEEEPEEESAELVTEVRELLKMLKHEVGMRWMSFPLRLQMERVEEMLDY
jgi:beta-phosphoglucomutase-like phosphatase (HAD superfamily)